MADGWFKWPLDVKTFGFVEICDKWEIYVNNDFEFRPAETRFTFADNDAHVPRSNVSDHLAQMEMILSICIMLV